MKKHHSKHHGEMAPNAGMSSEHGTKMAAEHHGAGMPDMGIGHETPAKMTHHWGEMAYSMEPESNGSMDYMKRKEHVASKDAGKIKRSFLSAEEQGK